MQEKCPVCGSQNIKAVDRTAKKYKCLSCDEIFTLEEKPVVKEVVREVIKEVVKEQPSDNFYSAKQVYDENIESIVEVNCAFDSVYSSGTGFYISDKGYIITNTHVVINYVGKKPVLCENVSVCKSRSTDYIEAEVLYLDPKNDLAILKTDTDKPVKAVKIAENDISIGEKLFTIGNSKGEGLMIVDGIVGDLNRSFKGTPVFIFNALVTHGCSGGAVFNDKGEVCGVTVGGAKEAAGMNYAINLHTLKDFITRAKEEKEIDF